MASVIGDTTCVIHPDRMAVARCPECQQFYCSECITEHEGRLTCASCLAARENKVSPPRRGAKVMPVVAVVVQLVVAVAVCWLIFFLLGETLGDIPDDFHDGTIWE